MPGIQYIPNQQNDTVESALERGTKTLALIKQMTMDQQRFSLENKQIQSQLETQGIQRQLLAQQLAQQQQYGDSLMQNQVEGGQLQNQALSQNLELGAQQFSLGQIKLNLAQNMAPLQLQDSALDHALKVTGLDRSNLENKQEQENLRASVFHNNQVEQMEKGMPDMLEMIGTSAYHDPRMGKQMRNLQGAPAMEALKSGLDSLSNEIRYNAQLKAETQSNLNNAFFKSAADFNGSPEMAGALKAFADAETDPAMKEIKTKIAQSMNGKNATSLDVLLEISNPKSDLYDPKGAALLYSSMSHVPIPLSPVKKQLINGQVTEVGGEPDYEMLQNQVKVFAALTRSNQVKKTSTTAPSTSTSAAETTATPVPPGATTQDDFAKTFLSTSKPGAMLQAPDGTPAPAYTPKEATDKGITGWYYDYSEPNERLRWKKIPKKTVTTPAEADAEIGMMQRP